MHFSEKMKKSRAEIKEFLFKKYYRNPSLMTQGIKMENIIQGLFKFYFENPLCLPYEWQELLSDDALKKKNIIYSNYSIFAAQKFLYFIYKI